jgi:fibronectin type 3 domain-containing protein
VPVNAKISLKNNILSYNIDYDPTKNLIIDPLIYSTFLGAGDEDKGFSIELDSSNNAYVTGETWSLGFPTTTGAYNSTNNGSMDIFVLKLNSAGNSLIYSTYIGGSDNEEGRDIAIDANNYAYITGYTESLDFPTTGNAYNRTFGGGLYDVFVLKLNSAGSSLAYSTYMGGSDYERGFSIALDSANNAYVTGYTWSFNFPVVGGGINKTLNGWEDVFVFKLDSAGSNLLYSTYIGGFGIDYGYSIALDSSNNAYITGYTESLNFPSTTGAFDQTNNGSGDIFVLKVNSAGNSLVYSTYIGGEDEDIGYAIAVDSSANAYVTGWTWSTDFPISSGAFKTKLNNWSDVIIIKLNSLGDKLIYSTYLGGTNDDFGRAITLDSVYNVYITGSTISPDFPTTSDAIDRRYNSWEDAFVFILSASGSNMMYSSFIGGTDEDFGYSIALDHSNYGYVTGYTLSPNFPITTGAKDTIYNDYEDAFILKLKFPPKPDAPKNLSSRDGDGFVHLNWEPPINVKKTSINNYIIYKGTSISDFNVFQVIDNIEYFNDTDVINGIKYYYAISAQNAMGEGNKSKIISAEPGAPPTKPTNLKVSPGFDHIQLIWDPPENNKGFDVNSYIIYRGLSEIKLLVLDTIGNLTDYNDTNVDPGRIYYYSISAYNQKGESERSDVITSAPGRTPSAPRNFTVEKINYYIFLTWSEPADKGGFNISRYRIYRGLDKDNLVLIGETDIISYVDTTSDIDMIYFYSVSAVNVKGEGAQTYLVLAKSGSVPPIPLLSGRVGENFVKLSWVLTNASSYEILYYKIYRGSSTSPLQLIAISTGLAYYDYNVSVDIIYSYIVSAVNEKGEGLKSKISNARLMGLPSAPVVMVIYF